MTERDDLERADWEGMALPLSEEERKDSLNLEKFLKTVLDEFKGPPRKTRNIMDVEEAAIVAITKMSEEQKKIVVDVAKKHLVLSICPLHEIDVVNDEEYEGALIDYELSTKNIGEFMAIEGSKSLRAHLKNMLGDKGWEEIKDIEFWRGLEADGYYNSISG